MVRLSVVGSVRAAAAMSAALRREWTSITTRSIVPLNGNGAS
jgi:hypothetical protein